MNQASDSVASSEAESTLTNMDSEGILKAIDDLNSVLKGDNAKLQQNIDHLGHEINGKLDNIATEVQGLAERVKGIRFQTPFTNIRIHWESGTRTYSSAQEAYSELKRRGIQVEEPATADGGSRVELCLRELLGWQSANNSGTAVALRAKDKLHDFQRSMAECK
ncbi:hypothetical protein GOODEAATRI_021795 [Goodea atripinnis]|uniref:Uncharacterized protein n=1 Tax=Goodea atripinnis TaxID=208336 RepID=A0ABV0MUA5_9TELE